MQGSYNIAWFGLRLRHGEILPTSAEDLIDHVISDEGEHGGDNEASKTNFLEETGKEGSRKEASGIGPGSDFLRSPKLEPLLDAFPAIMNLLRNLLRTIKFQDITCNLCIGLNDPVQTALMSGYFWSIASMLGLFRANFSFEPCFEEERLEGEFSTRLSVRLLWTMLAFINALREGKIRRLLLEFSRRA